MQSSCFYRHPQAKQHQADHPLGDRIRPSIKESAYSTASETIKKCRDTISWRSADQAQAAEQKSPVLGDLQGRKCRPIRLEKLCSQTLLAILKTEISLVVRKTPGSFFRARLSHFFEPGGFAPLSLVRRYACRAQGLYELRQTFFTELRTWVGLLVVVSSDSDRSGSRLVVEYSVLLVRVNVDTSKFTGYLY